MQPTLNPIDGSLAQTISDGVDLLDAGKYKAMVVGHQGPNFCAGANLASMIQVCEAGEYDKLEKAVKQIQDLTQRIRFSKAPIIGSSSSSRIRWRV